MEAVEEEVIPERRIKELTFVSQEHLNASPEKKGIRVDVECKDQDGARFIVEMQLAQQSHFYERAVFYSSFAIQDQLILVKIQSLLRVIGAVELVGVFKLFHIQSRDKDGIHISHSVGLRDPDDSVRHGLLSLEQQEVTGCCAGRCDREVHAAPHCSRAIQTVVAGPHEKAGDLIQLLFPADPPGHMRFRSYAVVFGIAAGLSFQEPPDYVKAPHND